MIADAVSPSNTLDQPGLDPGTTCDEENPGLIPGSERSPREGNGSPVQYSCLENSMDGEAWWGTAYGVTKSWTQLSDFIFFLSFLRMTLCK